MEAAVITAVGIDVSKSKSTVAVRRPGGEIVLRPFEVHHTNSDLKKLASTLKKLGGDIRIVMEHTSTYWRPIALTLKEAGFFVCVLHNVAERGKIVIAFQTVHTVVDGNQTNASLPQNLHNLTDLQIVAS